jgi:hypothetical protein
VRQGDPLSPLLFAIPTQPLLVRLDADLEAGKELGFEINNHLRICHRFFANDVGAFIPASQTAFKRQQEYLQIYERASGAKLNLQKSIIVPIAQQQPLDWLESTGCIIAGQREIIKYLGAPYGTNITATQIQKFCIKKLSKRITTFLPQIISLTGRVQIIKQVLMSMSVYHLMYLNLSATTRKVINNLC